MSFETKAGAQEEREVPKLSKSEEKLYDLLVTHGDQEAISPRDFVDLYGEKTVEHDEAYVQKLERQFTEEQKKDPGKATWVKRGKLVEAIIKDQAELSEWLGPNAHVTNTSSYDDYVNGVDGIVSFEEEGRTDSHLALAIDVTRSDKHLREKFEKVRKSIEEGELSRIKYFHSDTVRGELRKVPRVVVGADRITIENVSKLLLDFRLMQSHPASGREDLSQESKESRRQAFMKVRTELAEHPLQFQILFEIKAQLDAFKAYAESIGKDDVGTAYDQLLAIINEIIEDKTSGKRLRDIQAEVQQDEVYKMIIDKTKSFGQ